MIRGHLRNCDKNALGRTARSGSSRIIGEIFSPHGLKGQQHAPIDARPERQGARHLAGQRRLDTAMRAAQRERHAARVWASDACAPAVSGGSAYTVAMPAAVTMLKMT